MAFKINSLVHHLVPEVKESIIIRKIGKYAALKKMIDNKEEQSWYSNKAIANKIENLKTLKNEFEKIKNDFNSLNVDGLIETIKSKDELYKTCVQKTMPVFVKIWSSHSATNQIIYFSELLSLKSKINRMESIDYYVDRPDEVMNFV